MGIQVVCPNGHEFKVKDKYAGKKGLCPHCEGQVIVQVPDALTSFENNEEFQKETLRQRQSAEHRLEPKKSTSSSSVLDDSHDNIGLARHQRQLAGLFGVAAQHQVRLREQSADVVRPLPGLRGVSGALARAGAIASTARSGRLPLNSRHCVASFRHRRVRQPSATVSRLFAAKRSACAAGAPIIHSSMRQ